MKICLVIALLCGQGTMSSTSLTPWLCQDIQTFSGLMALCEGNPPVTGGFPPQRASNAELWCVLWCMFEQTVEQAMELLVILLPMWLIWHHCPGIFLTMSPSPPVCSQGSLSGQFDVPFYRGFQLVVPSVMSCPQQVGERSGWLFITSHVILWFHLGFTLTSAQCNTPTDRYNDYIYYTVHGSSLNAYTMSVFWGVINVCNLPNVITHFVLLSVRIHLF